MPQIIVCEWRVIFSENLLHKTVYPVKDPWGKVGQSMFVVIAQCVLHWHCIALHCIVLLQSQRLFNFNFCLELPSTTIY